MKKKNKKKNSRIGIDTIIEYDKFCFRCKKTKSLTEFYIKDEPIAICLDCHWEQQEYIKNLRSLENETTNDRI